MSKNQQRTNPSNFLTILSSVFKVSNIYILSEFQTVEMQELERFLWLNQLGLLSTESDFDSLQE